MTHAHTWTHSHTWHMSATEDLYACPCGVRITRRALDCIRHPERYEAGKRVEIVLGGIESRLDGPVSGDPVDFCAEGEDVRSAFATRETR